MLQDCGPGVGPGVAAVRQIPASFCLLRVCLCWWLEDAAKHMQAENTTDLYFSRSGKGRRLLLGGFKWDLVPAPLGFSVGSWPLRSSSCCLRVIHGPQLLMDSIQILVHPSPIPNVMIHVVAESRFLLASKAPDILYLRIIFFPGSHFFPSLTSPFLFQLYPTLGRGCSSITQHPLPMWPAMLLRDGGAGYSHSCRDAKVMLGAVGTASPQLYLLQRGAKSM